MAAPTTSQSVFRHPLTSALAGEGGVRLLRELARHGHLLSPRALADRTGLTVQGVRRVLKRLEALGLVAAVGSADRRLYQLNFLHPLAPALAALFDAEAARVDAVHGGIASALAHTSLPVLAAWVYGSVARGDDTATSDLDVAVVFDVADRTADATGGASGTGVETAIGSLREALAPLERVQHVTLSLVGLSRDDVARLSAGDPWWAGVSRDALPIVGPAPSALATRLLVVRKAASRNGGAAEDAGSGRRARKTTAPHKAVRASDGSHPGGKA